MDLKVTNIDTAYDPILNEAILSDVNQEVGFISDDLETKMYIEELLDKGAREAAGLCECCLGTGSYTDCGPHSSRKVPCENCNGTGYLDNKENKPHCPNCKDTKLVESSVPMVGAEECYYCKDQDD